MTVEAQSSLSSVIRSQFSNRFFPLVLELTYQQVLGPDSSASYSFHHLNPITVNLIEWALNAIQKCAVIAAALMLLLRQ